MTNCRFHNSEVVKLIDVGLENKAEVKVTCDGQWHKRSAFINRHGKRLDEAVICICPEYQEFWRGHLLKMAITDDERKKAENWTHISLKGRRA